MSSNNYVQKSVVCPQCEANITYLRKEITKVDSGTLKIDQYGGVYFELDTISPDKEVRFFCPECDSNLFFNEDDAIKFLRGDIE